MPDKAEGTVNVTKSYAYSKEAYMSFEYPVIDMKKTGANIRRLRLINHLTVNYISEALGFTTGIAVYKWQRGLSLPSVDNLLALSKMFKVSMNEILITTQEGDESPLPFLFAGLRGGSFPAGGQFFFDPGQRLQTA